MADAGPRAGGNHDDRESLRASFPLPGADDGGGLPLRPAAARCAWWPSTPPIPAASRARWAPSAWRGSTRAWPRSARPDGRGHAPSAAAAGHRGLDAIGLPERDRAALGEIIAGHPQVRRVLAGHVHRAALGSVGGCPVFTCPSTWIQGRLDFATRRAGGRARAAVLRGARRVAGELTTHVQPVGEW
jgi:hypothetical protein